MTEYGIIANTNPKEFLDDVNDAIKNGWKLQGGVSSACHMTGNSVSGYVNSFHYSQALIRKIKDK